MDRDEIWGTIDAERLRLADLLTQLSDEEWRQPSLCAGWTVRDVAAHLTLAHIRMPAVIAGMVRARGNLGIMIRETARRHAAAPAQLIEELRAMAGSRRHVPGITPMEPLIDVLVHGQDIALPLGRALPMPVGAAAAAATRICTNTSIHRGRRKLDGFRLTATDTSWSAGEGRSVEGPIEALLLTLTGRTVAAQRLSGAGAVAFTARMAQLPT
ncbi:MAG: hypothetical protein JWP33_388 [Blastococcus sp.]|nr:hypothetical protein [Blastococcus sp.]